MADAAGLCAARPPLQCHCYHAVQQCVLLVRLSSEVFSPSGPGLLGSPRWPLGLMEGELQGGQVLALGPGGLSLPINV